MEGRERWSARQAPRGEGRSVRRVPRSEATRQSGWQVPTDIRSSVPHQPLHTLICSGESIQCLSCQTSYFPIHSYCSILQFVMETVIRRTPTLGLRLRLQNGPIARRRRASSGPPPAESQTLGRSHTPRTPSANPPGDLHLTHRTAQPTRRASNI